MFFFCRQEIANRLPGTRLPEKVVEVLKLAPFARRAPARYSAAFPFTSPLSRIEKTANLNFFIPWYYHSNADAVVAKFADRFDALAAAPHAKKARVEAGDEEARRVGIHTWCFLEGFTWGVEKKKKIAPCFDLVHRLSLWAPWEGAKHQDGRTSSPSQGQHVSVVKKIERMGVEQS